MKLLQVQPLRDRHLPDIAIHLERVHGAIVRRHFSFRRGSRSQHRNPSKFCCVDTLYAKITVYTPHTSLPLASCLITRSSCAGSSSVCRTDPERIHVGYSE